MSDLSVSQAARQGVAKMRAMWPAFAWGDGSMVTSAARQYGEALEQVGDVAAIQAGVTAAIREVGGRFPPSVADLLVYVRGEVKRRPAVSPDNPDNRCPVCRDQGAELAVVVDVNGMASCVDGTHRSVWRAA